MSVEWVKSKPAEEASDTQPAVGWTGVERFCQACGAPWVLSEGPDGHVTGCSKHPGDPAHIAFVERLKGPPVKPLDIAGWATDTSPTRPQSAAAAAATEWLRAWVQNGLENLPRVRRDLQADIDEGEGRSPSRSLYGVLSSPIGGDVGKYNVDHLDSALRFLAQQIQNLGGTDSV